MTRKGQVGASSCISAVTGPHHRLGTHLSCLFLAAPNQTPCVADSKRAAPALCCPHVADLSVTKRDARWDGFLALFPLCVSRWACATAFAAPVREPRCGHRRGVRPDPNLTAFGPAAIVCRGHGSGSGQMGSAPAAAALVAVTPPASVPLSPQQRPHVSPRVVTL